MIAAAPGLRGRLPRWSFADWGLAAWTAAIVVAVISIEVVNGLSWTSDGYPLVVAVLAPLMGLGVWFAGLVLFWTLCMIGIWLFESAQGLAHSMRSPRP